jgi:hypothetical protein
MRNVVSGSGQRRRHDAGYQAMADAVPLNRL